MPGNLIPDGSITLAKLADSAVSNPKMVSNTIQFSRLNSNSSTESMRVAPRTARAFVHFDGIAMVIRQQFGVSGISRTAAGIYVVTFSAAFATDQYLMVGGADDSNTVSDDTRQVGSCGIVTRNHVGVLLDVAHISCVFFNE